MLLSAQLFGAKLSQAFKRAALISFTANPANAIRIEKTEAVFQTTSNLQKRNIRKIQTRNFPG